MRRLDDDSGSHRSLDGQKAIDLDAILSTRQSTNSRFVVMRHRKFGRCALSGATGHEQFSAADSDIGKRNRKGPVPTVGTSEEFRRKRDNDDVFREIVDLSTT